MLSVLICIQSWMFIEPEEENRKHVYIQLYVAIPVNKYEFSALQNKF